MAVIIAGFSSSDRVPGAYGEVLYGVGGQNAASIPNICLLVGLMTSTGSLPVDTNVQQIFSKTDADTYAGAGSELAGMAYDALDTAPDVPLFIASPGLPGGAVKAGASILFTGSIAAAGQVGIRVGGKVINYNISATDTLATAATNFAAVITGAFAGRVQISATGVGNAVVIVWRTPSIRGNQAEIFLDATQLPSTMGATSTGLVWPTATAFAVGSYVHPTTANGFYYKNTAIAGTGTTAAVTEPTWPTTIGSTVVDNAGANQITWTCWGQILNGGIITLGGGTGTETYTTLLATLLGSQYDRIALAANDSSSLAAWKTQIDAQAAAPINILQHVDVALNTTLAAATALAQTTLNDQRFQFLWEQSAETHPSRMAAATAALRASTEQQDPDAAYNYFPVPTIAPQTQKGDWASHAVLVSAINNSVTPVTSIGDGFSRIVRSITTKSLTSAVPDYSTLDTGQAVVPDFVLKDLKLYWTTVFAPANPRVQDEPAAGQRNPPSGVAYPSLWASAVQAKLVNYAKGILSGTTASVAPILINVVPPVANFDNVAKRIMIAVTVTPAYNDSQTGVSVRQTA